jgi:magnesium chelatase subunit I
VEQIAFSAREDKKVDKRSGVSQRLPITTMELVVSNAERRALMHNEDLAVARVGDVYAALPGITGKIELEYEGEMRGADTVVREIIRTAVAQVFDLYFASTNTQQIEQWFNLGGTVQLNDAQPSAGSLVELQQIQGLIEKLAPLQVNAKTRPELVGGGVSAGGDVRAQTAEPDGGAQLLGGREEGAPGRRRALCGEDPRARCGA